MVARQSIHGPVSRDYVRIVVPAPDGFGIDFLPTRPGGPVERGIVFELRQILRRVVKETLPHAVAVWSLFVLQAAPQHAEEHTSELQSPCNLVCRLLLEKKKKDRKY